MNIKLTIFHFSFLILSLNSYAQDCDDININTNVESTYTLCNNSIDLEFEIINPEQYETVNWILDDGQYYNNQTYANFTINEVGLYTLTIQVEDLNECLDYEQINFQILEGPNSANTSANLNSSLSNHDCLDIGTSFELTTEIISVFSPSSIYWQQTGITTPTDYSFDVEVGNNDVFNYPVEIQFDACNVPLILEHQYTVQYETSFNHDYNGNLLCKDDKITLINTSPNASWDTDFEWDVGNDVEIIYESQNSIEFLPINGTYTWKLDYIGSCPSSDQETVSVNLADDNDHVTAAINASDFEYCELPYNLDVNVLTPSTGNLSYNWELNLDNTLITSSTSETFQHEIETAGVYNLTLEVSDDNLSCSAKDSIEISMDGLNLNLDVESLYECKNYIFKPMDFALNNLDATVNCLWEIIDLNGNIVDSSTEQNPSFNMSEEGVFDLSIDLSSNINDCENTILLENIIEIYEPQIALELDLLESNSCFSDSEQSIEKTIYAQFNDPSVTITNHEWSISSESGVTTISSTEDEIKLTFTEAGNYSVTYTANIAGSDCNYKEKIDFGIDAIVEINMYETICLGNEFTITQIADAGVGTNTSFLWSSPNNDLVIANANQETTTVMTEVTGDYTLELAVTNNLGCSASDVVTFEAYEVSAMLNTEQSEELCSPAIIELESLNNNYITNYTWNIYETTYEDNETMTTNVTTSPSFETLLNEIASYDIELIVNSQHGCSDTTLVEDYINTISPLPYFTLSDPIISCDSVYQDIIDESIFIDSYSINYGNDDTSNYVLNDTNSTIYTYLTGTSAPSQDYFITLSVQYKFCFATHTEIVTINQPELPPPPIINYVTVTPEQDVMIEWSTENLVDNLNSIDLYHQTSNPWSLINSSSQMFPNQTSHDTPTNQVNHYTAVQQDSCAHFSDSSIVHSPILLNSVSTSPQTINLNWTRYYGWDSVLSYKIFRSEEGAEYLLHDSVEGDILSYKDSNLCNVIYSYYVVADHPTYEFQSRSNNTSLTPNFIDYTTPIDVKYTTVNLSEEIETKWDAPIISDLTYYKIDRYDNFSNWVFDYDSSSSSVYIDNNVNVNARNYAYRISYSDLCGNTGPLNGNTGENILLRGTQSKNEFNLNWNQYQEWDDGLVEHLILKVNQTNNTYETINSVSGSEFNYVIDNYFNQIDTNYCYKVVAINAADPTIQSHSNVRCFIPPATNYFPNAFSPNNDEINDTYKFRGLFAKKLEVQIFDCWGKLIFSSNKVDFEWDGKNKNTGKLCPQGSYNMKYKITGYDEFSIKDEIPIMLLR
ncbi:MAG: hypothetical protein CND86_04820 [Bacteroidetes bacterium MED-G21]|nr:MAG: hypothetical protein CND86_04820 [Bacteroidetes bacterium MED-G21]